MRDWTPSDRAEAAEADADRNWWRRDPYADPDYRANPIPSDPHAEDTAAAIHELIKGEADDRS